MTAGRPVLRRAEPHKITAGNLLSREARNLVPSQRAFIHHLFQTGNAIEAAQRAGYARPHVTARLLVRQRKIGVAIEAERAALAESWEKLLCPTAPL